MQQIPLGGKRGEGKFALVDDTDFERLSQFRWHLNSKGYVVRGFLVKDRKHTTRRMHRELLTVKAEEDVHHIDGNRLNNCRANLLPCTKTQHKRLDLPARGSSKYRGVSWSSGRRKWQATIQLPGHYSLYLGRYPTEEGAARVYDRAAIKHFGRFADPNFPQREVA